jgi:glycosyltransferase involved in cell wall biosynthesis
LRVLLLADINSIHTQKWAVVLKSRGIDIAVFSLNKLNFAHPELQNIPLFHPDNFNKDLSSAGFLQKIKYFTTIPSLRKCIRTFVPDIIHAHYASSYGILGSLIGFHPYILSVWGSDIYDFPNSSFLAKKLIRYNLKKADRILATSHVMAEETQKYTDKKIDITPFGVDLTKFKRYPVKSLFAPGSIIIGTIKALEIKYGIEYLIEVFGKLHYKFPEMSLKLLIAGGGTLETFLKERTHSLGLDSEVVFTGKIPHEEVPDYLNMLDIYSALSISDSESFGVAVIEASACELPVVVSNIGGLKEVVEDEVTGLLVAPKSIEDAVMAFERLLINKELRKEIGRNGRKRIINLYNWSDNVDSMIAIYQHFFTGNP